ncbi:MAG: ABC transporter permease [Dactylosporangium sp.]|nr:ABC transporter permease [Dactylosporangium sp.]NNJ60121.1 ABC transporter permease [Dactylosporangium sp.]
MSAAEKAALRESGTPGETSAAASASGPRSQRLPNPRFLRSELWLIFGRRRNWAGLAVLASVPLIIAIAVKINNPGSAGGEFNVFSSITDNGLFVALAALTVEIQLFLPIAVASISSDAIAGEANLGTLRYLLAVPVLRSRMLAVKFTAIVIFTFVAILLVAGVGMLIGLALFGGGSMVSLSGTSLSFGTGVWRILLICGYLAIELSALSAIGLFVSSLTEQPIGAAIAVIIIMIMSFILDQIPPLDWLHPYLFTHHWYGFTEFLRDPVSFGGPVRDGVLNAAAYIAVCYSAAWARFSGRDVTN